MALKDVCLPKNFAWESELADAYHYTNANGETRTVIHYQIPLPSNKQNVFMARYNIAGTEMRGFYQNLVHCIQQEVSVSKHLTEHNVASILSFSAMEQSRDDKGVSHIYLETEQIWPLMDKVLINPTPSITVLDVIYRLSVVLRDISKEPVYVVHRGLDLNEVFINRENRIKVGGFYYASYPGSYSYPDYLPNRPSNLPIAFLNGEIGHQGLDLMSLALVAWNLLSGHAHDAKLTNSRWVFPRYATEDLVDAIKIGLSGNEETCHVFRRRLQECRKRLSKTNYSAQFIPIHKQALKDISVEYVVIPDTPD